MQNTNRSRGLHSRGEAWYQPLFDAGRVSSDDVAALRETFPMGLVTQADAELFFRIERDVLLRCPAWGELFCEFTSDFVVWGERPTGQVSERQATWVLEQIALTGTPIAIATGLVIVSEAHDAPAWLAVALERLALGSNLQAA